MTRIQDMTLDEFKARHQELFDKGVIKILSIHPMDRIINQHIPDTPSNVYSQNKTMIRVDRYVDGKFVADRNELLLPISHLKKMGFTKDFGIGIYSRLK